MGIFLRASCGHTVPIPEPVNNNNIILASLKRHFRSNMEDLKSIASRGIPSRRNNRQGVCRVCLKKARGMVNIFAELGDSIVDMISECTGFHVFKGDSFPETICPPCLQDAINAFEIKQTYEGSHQLKQDSEEHKDVLGEENCVQGIEFQVKKEGIEHLLEESAPQMEYFQIDEYLPDEGKDEPFEEYLPGEVMNEPIEEDPLEENLDYNIDPSHLQGNSAGTDTHDDEYEQCPNLCTGNGDVINNAEEIPFQCSSCPRLFKTLRQLKMHNYTHAEPTFKCDYCEQAFVHQSALTQHVRTHTGERPFKCFICQQDFKTKTQFSLHFKSHPLNSLFKCSRCELDYTSKEELDQHFKTHTMYNCSQCKRVFQSQRLLKNHVRSAHIKKTSPTATNPLPKIRRSARACVAHTRNTYTMPSPSSVPTAKYPFAETRISRSTSKKYHL